MRMAFAVGLILSIPSILNAQDWREKLAADLVVHIDDKMVIEKYSIERVNLPGYAPVEFQVKYHTETPHDGAISRDNFVDFSAYYGATIIQAMLAEDYDVSAAAFLAAYESEDLDAPIGTPDLEISIVMTGEGIQVEIRNTLTNEVSRSTETWEPLSVRQGVLESQNPVRVTGIYSDLVYSEQSGDMRGTEIMISYSEAGFYAIVQGAEGPLGCPVVAPAVVNELAIQFTLPPAPCMFGVPSGIRFLGVVSADGLRGHFEGYEDWELELPRGQSYWQ